MGKFTALDALTSKNPTERQWIVRAASEIAIKDGLVEKPEMIGLWERVAAIYAAGQLATNAALYLARLTTHGWARLEVDIRICTSWAIDQRWVF